MHKFNTCVRTCINTCIQMADGAKIDQNRLKMSSKRLSLHPQWSRITFGKTHF